MPGYLLDTNVLAEPARPSPDANVVRWLAAEQAHRLSISVLTVGEIQKGVSLLPDGAKRRRLEEWLEEEIARRFGERLLAVDGAVARTWGRLAAEGARAGRPLPVVDGLLLATAAAHGLTLATRNTSDCRGRGVPVLDPWTGALHEG